MQKYVHTCIIMQASVQECRRTWPGLPANIRQESGGKLPSWRDLLRESWPEWPRLAELSAMATAGLASLDRRRICQEWRQRLAVEPFAALVAYRPGAIHANVAALVECVQDSKQDNAQEGKKKRHACTGWANSSGVYVARLLSLPGVGMRGLYGTLDNARSVGALRLLSMCRANTINSKAARLYVWGFHVVRCMCGGMCGRTYGALLFAHGIG